jgi:magnesium transporter
MQNSHSHLQNSQHETAARHLVKRVPTVNPDETVASVLERLPGNVFDYSDTVYVVDEINTRSA